jgi:hypothetical protein
MNNFNQKIKNLRGEEVPKSLPTRKELDKLPKDKDGKPDLSKLERETVGNIILNCLANYIVRDRKEGFYINSIAQSILSGDKKIEFKDKFKKFLIEVLDDMTHRRETEKDDKGEKKEIEKGLYAAWAISQVKQELKVEEE